MDRFTVASLTCFWTTDLKLEFPDLTFAILFFLTKVTRESGGLIFTFEISTKQRGEKTHKTNGLIFATTFYQAKNKKEFKL